MNLVCDKCGRAASEFDERGDFCDDEFRPMDRCNGRFEEPDEPTEAEQIAEHCKANNITHHSIDADGNC